MLLSRSCKTRLYDGLPSFTKEHEDKWEQAAIDHEQNVEDPGALLVSADRSSKRT